MSKYGIISDIHANAHALKAVYEQLGTMDIDRILCLGDIVGYGPSPTKCLDLVLSYCHEVIKGNHDEAVLDPDLGRYFNNAALAALNWTREQLGPYHLHAISHMKTRIRLGDSLLLVHDTPILNDSAYIHELPCDEGLQKLTKEGSKFKIDNAERAIQNGSSTLSWYVTGNPNEHWEDLCRGPHVPSTGAIGAFKLQTIASSYWHGDSDSDRLTRVYGIAFVHKKQLKSHLKLLEEAKKRDHRIIGKKLGLFHIDEMVGQGLLLWTPNGAIVRQELQNFIAEQLRRQQYSQVFTPHIGKLDLYRTSGHYPFYQDSQYPPLIDPDQLQALAKDGCSCGDLPCNCEDTIYVYCKSGNRSGTFTLYLRSLGYSKCQSIAGGFEEWGESE